MNHPINPLKRPGVILAVGALLLGLSIGTFPSDDRSLEELIKHLLPAVAGLICIHHGVKGLLRT